MIASNKPLRFISHAEAVRILDTYKDKKDTYWKYTPMASNFIYKIANNQWMLIRPSHTVKNTWWICEIYNDDLFKMNSDINETNTEERILNEEKRVLAEVKSIKEENQQHQEELKKQHQEVKYQRIEELKKHYQEARRQRIKELQKQCRERLEKQKQEELEKQQQEELEKQQEELEKQQQILKQKVVNRLKKYLLTIMREDPWHLSLTIYSDCLDSVEDIIDRGTFHDLFSTNDINQLVKQVNEQAIKLFKEKNKDEYLQILNFIKDKLDNEAKAYILMNKKPLEMLFEDAYSDYINDTRSDCSPYKWNRIYCDLHIDDMIDKAYTDISVKHLDEVIDTHHKALLRIYNQSVFEDGYGGINKKKWEKEVKYFFEDIVCNPYWLDDKHHLKSSKISTYTSMIEEKLQKYKEEAVEENEKIVSGVDYEHYIADMIRELGYSVRNTPATGDQGVDLVIDEQDIKIAIQCKYYSQPVGNKAVQEVKAGQGYYDCDYACVVSNAKYTPAAKALANKLQVRLLNKDTLLDFLHEIFG